MAERTIDNGYNAHKFDDIIRKETEALVKSTMGKDADSEKGRAFQRQAAENLKNAFLSLPVVFYQALDGFADGKDFREYLKPTEDTELPEETSFLDLVLACGDRKLEPKNEKAAQSYYERLFPTPKTAKQSAALGREEAIAEGKRAAKELLASHKDSRKEQSGALKGREARRVIKAGDALARARADVLELEALAKVGLMNESEKKRYESALLRLEESRSAYRRLTGIDVGEQKKEVEEQKSEPVEAITPTSEKAEKTVEPTSEIHRQRVDFKEKHIDLGGSSRQTPIGKEKGEAASLDASEKERDEG